MTPRRSALLALPALALTLTPVHADAAGNTWKNMTSINKGTVQACKVPTTSTGPWKIKLRVDARRATGKVQGLARPYKSGKELNAGWTSAYVRPGNVSTVAVVKLPRGAAYSMMIGINTGQAGNGGSFKAADFPRC